MSTKGRTVIECFVLCLSVIFIITGRIMKKDIILGIPTSSIVAGISIFIVFCTGVEGMNSIAVNMFNAKPKIYIDAEVRR